MIETMKLALSFLLSVGFLLSLPTPAAALRIAIVGDSQAQAFAPRLAREYESRGHTVSIVTEPGWSSARFRRQGTLSRRVGHVDAAVVFLGGNHLRIDNDTYASDLSWIVSQLRAAGADTIIWFGPLWASAPGYRRRHRETRNLQRKMLQDVRWIDLYHSTESYPLRNDGVHFRWRAYTRIVEDVLVPILFP